LYVTIIKEAVFRSPVSAGDFFLLTPPIHAGETQFEYYDLPDAVKDKYTASDCLVP